MFFCTFRNCPKLSGTIPENIFHHIYGLPGTHTFDGTFSHCPSLQCSIPPRLFENIIGTLNEDDQQSLFKGTFYSCSGLTGSIPKNLFSGLNGQIAHEMFNSTFQLTENLSSFVPVELFATITNQEGKTSIMSNVFTNSGIVEECPAGYYKYNSIYDQYWSNKVSCTK